MLVLDAVFLVLDHGVLGLDVIDLVVEDDEAVLLVLQLVEFLLEHGDYSVALHGLGLLEGAGALVHHHNKVVMLYLGEAIPIRETDMPGNKDETNR